MARRLVGGLRTGEALLLAAFLGWWFFEAAGPLRILSSADYCATIASRPSKAARCASVLYRAKKFGARLGDPLQSASGCFCS